MATIELFSKRRRRELIGAKAEVYKYDNLPKPLRVQIAHIWRDAIGDANVPYTGADERWKIIHDIMAREKGVFALGSSGQGDHRCVEWMLAADVEDALDIIELTFRYIESLSQQWHPHQYERMGVTIAAEEAVLELNERFREHCVGYQFESGRIIRTDSQFIHAEVVKPALALLAGAPFEIANKEFLLAHQHYREGKFPDAIVAAQRAFESTLKTICTEKRWTFNKGDKFTELVKAVRAQGLFPAYLDSGFDCYIAMLKTGLPGVRNNAGGHGAEPSAAPVPSYIAAYALHMTASNIVLAVEASHSSARTNLRRK